MNNWCIGFSHILLMRILIFKELTSRRLYKSFGFKGLITSKTVCEFDGKPGTIICAPLLIYEQRLHSMSL
jgi:hypothetical protein